MVISVRTTSNLNRWLRKFEKEEGKLRQDVVNEPGLQAKFGQRLGVQLAPRDQYATLVHAIAFKVANKDQNRGTGLIFVRPLVHPVDNKSRRTKGRASAYAAIHHILPRGAYSRGQARSNDPHWLFTVRGVLEDRYKQRILGHIQRFR